MSSRRHPGMSSSSSDPPDSDAISSPEPVKLGKRKNKRSESPEPSRPGKRKHKHSSGNTSTNDLINSISSGSRKKTTRKHEDSKMDDAELYQNAGRKALSLLDTFRVPAAAFKTGLTFNRGGKRDPKQPQDVAEHHLLLYNAIIDFIPGFDSELDNITSKELNVVIAMVAKGMSEGRSADLNSVKHKGLQYIPLNMYSKEHAHALDSPIPEVKDKSMRGLNHPQLARLLCPRKKLECAMTAMQAGEITMTAHNWPMFFYDDSIYDAADKTKGLFRNHTAIRFYKHLFIGPSSVTNDSSNVHNSAKPSKNRAWGLTAVNKYIIAYVHIIAYFTISSTQHWMRYIGDMDLEELLWAIIKMLHDDSNPWVKDTLMWWNSHLKPTKDNLHSTKLTRKESEDYLAQIRAQRAAHRSALDKSNAPSHVNTTMMGICYMHPNNFGDQADDLPSPHHTTPSPMLSVMPQFMMTTKRLQDCNNQPTLDCMGNSTHYLPSPNYWHHVVISDDDENDDGDEVEVVAQPKQPRSDPHVPLPLRFNKPQYSTSDHGKAPTSMRPVHGATGSDGEEHQPQLSEPQHPASASVHYDDEDQPPRPKLKPKPKPQRPAARDEHEDSLSAHVTEQSLNVIRSQPVSPPRCPSPPLSDLTDNDNNFSLPTPTAPVPTKKRGRKKITDPNAPRRTSV
ncbi:hypothetical protein DFJ58DRAFT_728657 [Suillus subalutaceus]|uniref:uncharacterized protein n=1 Tax=Suillus subalutaceus TaxID=48586 RepID=UPI001B87F21D|nr:uncharacterized protein DFJ58DRAFT_728657 [Suillus subalutaceus]KAG1852113.1 hypothetical protein DFJ58DRAFT_728657 [Suillus subalutaceus]